MGAPPRVTRVAILSPDYALRLLLLTVAYYLVARLGRGLATVHPVISPLWPPTGVAMAALILGGRRLWPGVLLGAFLTNAGLVGAGMSLAIAAGNTLEALAGAWLCRSLAGRVRPLTRLSDALRLLAAAGLAPVISATIGIGTLTAGGGLPGSTAPLAWVLWWSGDVFGTLLAAPLLLAWAGRQPAFGSWQRAL